MLKITHMHIILDTWTDIYVRCVCAWSTAINKSFPEKCIFSLQKTEAYIYAYMGLLETVEKNFFFTKSAIFVWNNLLKRLKHESSSNIMCISLISSNFFFVTFVQPWFVKINNEKWVSLWSHFSPIRMKLNENVKRIMAQYDAFF